MKRLNLLIAALTAISRKMVISAAEYDLIVIEENDVPLAAGIGHTNYYIATLFVLIALMIVAAFTAWFLKRREYAGRLSELSKKAGTDIKIPITIRRIKEEIAIAECELASAIG